MQALLPALRQSHVERVSAPLQTAEATRSDIASIIATRHILRSGYLIMSKADCLANTHFYITLASKQGEPDRLPTSFLHGMRCSHRRRCVSQS